MKTGWSWSVGAHLGSPERDQGRGWLNRSSFPSFRAGRCPNTATSARAEGVTAAAFPFWGRIKPKQPLTKQKRPWQVKHFISNLFVIPAADFYSNKTRCCLQTVSCTARNSHVSTKFLKKDTNANLDIKINIFNLSCL